MKIGGKKNRILETLGKINGDGMNPDDNIIRVIPTLWWDVTKDYKPPHVKSGCTIGGRVTQMFICLSVHMLRWWAVAAVKCR